MKKISNWVRGILFLILFYLLFFLPLPYYIEVPGSVLSLDEMVVVDKQATDYAGDFYITTVGVRKATPVGILSSFLPYHDILSKSDLYGNLDDFEDYDKMQKYYMESSINNAIKAAFEAADQEYQFDYKGVYVLQVTEESDFYGDLKIGDTITSVDGNKFGSSQEFISYIENKNINDEIILEIKRENEKIRLCGAIVELESGSSGIGIGLVDDTTLVTEPTVTINSENIGGPSAGLMFSLEIYTKLVAETIDNSYHIAGTGTIEADGSVGRIGGIEKKVVAADKEGIDYFFAPDDIIPDADNQIRPAIPSNYQIAVTTAEKLGSDMEIVPIQTIYYAIDFLEHLGKESTNKNSSHIIDELIFNRNIHLEKLVANK